jgi:tetratricopeptide (TPR) repeat protein
MPTPFLSSEEYDERAHRLYNDGEYEAALETLKEGLQFYPHSVELYVGLGYARLAREEYAWARESFARALVLDPEHEDAMVGLGESLLRFGRHEESLELFRHARDIVCGEDVEIMLSIGRALYRESLYEQARDVFEETVRAHPQNAEVIAGLGYTLHRLGDEDGALRQLRRALRKDSSFHEARIYLGHLLYDRGEWKAAHDALEQVPPSEHWDPVAIWRLLELKRALYAIEPGHADLASWERRLEELENQTDAIEALLSEVELRFLEPSQLELFSPDGTEGVHRVTLADGTVHAGTWLDLVMQLRDTRGRPGENVADFMRRIAAEAGRAAAVHVESDDPEGFVRGCARAGLFDLEV